jgi:hypothetical protein
VRVVEAAVVESESDEHGGRIEVYLEPDSERFIAATMTPRKPDGNQ